MLSDPQSYSETRKLQFYETQMFVSSVMKKMNWNQGEHDVVMDVGCGSGDSYVKQILPAFPKVKKVIGIDILPEMIKFAKNNNDNEKIEYHVADIENGESLKRWKGKVTKIISILCLQWCKDQQEAFTNIYQLLEPGGEAGLVFAITVPFWDSYQDQITNPKWSKYLEDIDLCVPKSHYEKYGVEYYKTLLETIGFNVVTAKTENRMFDFPDDESYAEASCQIYSLTKAIPQDLKTEFKKDVLKAMLQYNGRLSDGRPFIRYTVMQLFIQKPIKIVF